jgi:hypothetical protein
LLNNTQKSFVGARVWDGAGLADAIAWFFATILVIIGLCLTGHYVFELVIPPQSSLDAAKAIGLWLPLKGLMKPEPVENATFAFGVCAAVLFCVATAWASVRAESGLAVRKGIWLAGALGLLASLAWIAFVHWDTILSPTPSVLVTAPLAKPGRFLLIGLAATGLTVAALSGKGRWLAIPLAAIPLILMVRPALVVNGEEVTAMTHFEVFSYPIFQDWFGSGLYLGADGQKSQYGLYPVFLWPIWKLLGPPTPNRISLVMAPLLFLSNLALVAFMARFTRKAALGAVFGVAGVLTAALLYPFWPGDVDFAFLPIRLVFPGLAFALLVWPATRKRHFLSYLLLAPGLLWNFESGVVGLSVYASFTTAVAFTPSWRAFARLAGGQVVLICVAAAVAVVALDVDYLLRFHASPDLLVLLHSIKAFSSGAGAEPMPPFGAWGLHCLVYMLSAFVGLRSLWRGSEGEDRYRAAALLAMALVGVLWLRYYQGRSLPLPLALVTAPAICCLGLLIDHAGGRSKTAGRAAALATVVTAGLFLGAFGAWLADNPLPQRNLAAVLAKTEPSRLGGKAASVIEDFHALTTSADDKLLVIAPYASQVNMELGQAGPIKSAGACQLWFQSEVDQAIAAIRKPETKMVVLDPGGPNCWLVPIWPGYDPGITEALATNYVERSSSAGCGVSADPSGPLVFVRKGMAAAPAAERDLALGRPAAQASTYADAAASRAVDGNTCGQYPRGSVAHTSLTRQPWWQVDLGTPAAIDAIEIWNRSDCCSERLSPFWVFVSDTPFRADDTPATVKDRPGVWGKRLETPPEPSKTILVGRSGRFVRVQLESETWLALAEVKVLGH